MKSQRPPPRVLLDEPIGSRRELKLSAAQANYVNRVLRLRVDAPLIVFDGHGGEFSARIVAYKKKSALLELGETLPAMPPPALPILLLQGISKADRMDFAIQKATELGVAEIFPVYTQFSVVKLDATRAPRRREHWQRVAGSACEQSGRHFPPRIHPPQQLHECVATLPEDALRFAFDPRGTQRLEAAGRPPHKIAAVIGPEGGFSPDELTLLDESGFGLIKLGDQILRTETATLVVCTLLQARWGELRNLNPNPGPG